MKIKKNVLISIEKSDIKNGNLVIPKNVTKIADNIINNISELVTFVGEGIEEINLFNFIDCEFLVNFDAPQLTKIEFSNFRSCKSLVVFNAPKLSKIETSNFRSCKSLVDFYAPKLTAILYDNFYDCPSLEALNIPELRDIGTTNFFECESLITFNAPKLTKVGYDNFLDCPSLTSFNAPQLIEIEDGNFSDCSSLVNVTLNKYKLKLKPMGETFFVVENTKSLKGINIYYGYKFFAMSNNIIEKTNCFVAEKKNFAAYGDTIEKAIINLEQKLS